MVVSTGAEHKYFNPLPLYRGRQHATRNATHNKNFNPLPLYRGRQFTLLINPSFWYISIHFLYTEEDAIAIPTGPVNAAFQSTSSIQRKTVFHAPGIDTVKFQSTSSIQRKTTRLHLWHIIRYISIHFLYTEEDPDRLSGSYLACNFNPLPLYRGRPLWNTPGTICSTFQSTSSIQRKTRQLSI